VALFCRPLNRSDGQNGVNSTSIGGSSDRLIRSYFQGVIDGRKATKNGKGSERVMLLGDTGTWDERGRDIDKTEHRVLDGKRIRDEGRQIVEEQGLKLLDEDIE